MNAKRVLALLISLGIPGVFYVNYIFIPALLKVTWVHAIYLVIGIIVGVPWFLILMYGLTGWKPKRQPAVSPD